MTLYRLDETFALYECGYCNPDLALEGDQAGSEYAKPYVLGQPASEERPNYCPRCGSYLSFNECPLKVRVTRAADGR